MTNRPVLRAVAGAALVFLVVLAGCGGHADQQSNSTGGKPVGATKGAQAPDFKLETVGGGSVQLADLRGQAVIVDFWDTWCPPCRRALPHLQELQDQYAGKLTVVGVAFGRDGQDAVAKFLAERNMTFTCALMDADFTTAAAYGGVQSIPTTFLIDPEGVIREIWVGGYEKADYEAAIRLVLGA